MHLMKLYYQILDVAVSVESDSVEFLELFDDNYCLFRTHTISNNKILECTIILSRKDSDAFIKINNKVLSLNGHPDKFNYILLKFVSNLIEQIEDYLLIHSGVVARNGKAVILAGPSCVGKTTLTLELVKNGFVFYSDEFCPIHKETKLVHPFLRSIWVKPEQREKLCHTSMSGNILSDSCSNLDTEVIVKPNEIKFPIANKPCKIEALICIEPDPPANKDLYLLHVCVKLHNDNFFNELKKIKDVAIEILDTKPLTWQLRYKNDFVISKTILNIINKYKEIIWDFYQVYPICANYNKDPLIIPVSNYDAILSLIGDLQQGPNSKAEKKAFSSGPTNFFMEVCGILDAVSCYKLSVGKLEKMNNLIQQVI